MALLLKELSQLEVEALEVVINAELKQDRSLDTLTTAQSEVATILGRKGIIPMAVACCCHCCQDSCCDNSPSGP